MFLGYSSTQKGYKCYNPVSKKLFVSRDVRFDENTPYYSKTHEAVGQREDTFSDLVMLPICPVSTNADSTHHMPSIDLSSSHDPEVELQNEHVEDLDNPHNHHEDQSNVEASNTPLRRNPTRDRRPPTRLQDYVIYNAKHPITNFVSYHKFSPRHAAFLSAVSSTHDPQSFQDATLQAVWRKAMQEELQALDDNNTWSIVELSKGKKAVGSRWIYKTKFHSDGSIERHKARLKLAIKDLGVLKYFLGIEMATSHKGLFLNQRKYALDLLQESGMLDSKPARTPLDSKLKLDMEGEPLNDIRYYQRLVGKLIYLTITRPDITYAVSIVSQFMHSPTILHLNVVKRILRYLKGSVGRNLVTWKSKKQPVIARSSAEAEYRAMASTACELIWLKGLLADLGFCHNQSMLLFCDNQAALHIASNPVFHERTKHIEVDCHYIRAHVQSKVIQTRYT
ncbi:unnamed protein product, partial [Prunus brigantina]